MNNEKVKLAKHDAELLQELSNELLAYVFAVEACGHDGKIENEKIEKLAPRAIKALANYL